VFGIKLNKNQPDEVLIALYQQNNKPEIIGELFKRYTSLIYSISYKYLKDSDKCKDMAMDVFELLIEKLKTHQVVNFKSWLHTVVRNECLMMLREETRSYSFDDTLKNGSNNFMEEDPFLHLDYVEREKKLVCLEICIEKLNIEQKTCVELFYLKQMSYVDISDETGYDLKKVKSYIQNGKRNLKILIENYNAGK